LTHQRADHVVRFTERQALLHQEVGQIGGA
jgi:hypothetical protein